MAARNSGPPRRRSHMGAVFGCPITPGYSARRPGPPHRRWCRLGGVHAAVLAELIADVQIWRAATQVDSSDLRPTGPLQLGHAGQTWQRQLDKRLATAATEEAWRWRQLLATEVPSVTADPFLPELTERLSNLSRAGFDAALLVWSASAEGPLPDDHPSAALWWRIVDRLAPQMPNRHPATPNPTATTSPGRQRPVPRSAPPRGFGPSR